jgi:hypothetical protein
MSYRDIEMKIAFHKERILKGFIKQGIIPSDALIADKLSEIDSGLALFHHDAIKEGDSFNVDAYNKSLANIYQDISFLYKLLYELTSKEFYTLKAFVDSHLGGLNDIVNLYKLKIEQETNSTAFGKTLLIKKNDITIKRNNAQVILDLGSFDTTKGSTLACIANIDDIEGNKIYFTLDDGTTVKNVASYNYNGDLFDVPGNVTMKNYTTNLSDNQVVNGPVEMNLGGVSPSINNKYIIMGGKNKLLVKNIDYITGQVVEERPMQGDMLSFDSHCYIDFYVVGGNTVTFKYNKKPITANFPLSNYTVTNLKRIHHFFLEVDAGFAFNFDLDSGDAYAIREDGVINNGKLYAANNVDIKDFYVEECTPGDKVTYNAQVIVLNDDNTPINVDSIIIKQLDSIGGV